MIRTLTNLLNIANQLMASRSERGPYRFLVRDWQRLSDLDLAARVLGTDFFATQLAPVRLPYEKLSSVLVLAPHQDDEAIGAGGTLLLARRAAVRLSVLFVTDGAQTNKPAIASTPAETVKVRDAEAREVAEMVGASIYRLGISNITMSATAAHLEELGRVIETVSPEVILVPWLLDSPAKHRFVNHLLWILLSQRAVPAREIWGYQVHNSLFPNGFVDYTEVAEEKRQMLQCYRSQNENITRYDHIALGMGAWNSRYANSTVPRFWELFFTLPVREYVDLLRRFYFTDPLKTYRGRNDILAGIWPLHNQVVGRDRSLRAVKSRRPWPYSIRRAVADHE